MRLERTVSWSQTRRDTNFAIPGYSISAIISRRGRKSKIFLSVVIYVVKATFIPLSAIGESPANTSATRLCGVSPCPVLDTTTALPNQARYQLRYTRIFNFCHYITAGEKIKDFSVCGHLCGQSHFYTAFGNRGKSRKHKRHKALRRFALPRPGYNHGTPKASALPTALIPDFWLLSFAPDVVKHVVRRFFWPPRLAGEVPVSQVYQGIADIAFSGLKGERPAPKPDAIPTSLYPDIQFLP